MKETAQSWWRQLAPRERQLISWGGAGLLVALCYAYLWQPIEVERNKLRASLPQLRTSAEKMRQQAQEAIQLKTSVTPAPRGETIRSAILQAANQAGLDNKILQINLLDDSRANITLTAVSIDTWAIMLANLHKKQRIRLESCTIEPLPETGMASVRAVVTSG